MICSANQWTGFYMIGVSVMKELILEAKFDDDPLDIFLGIVNEALNETALLTHEYVRSNDDSSQKNNITVAVTKQTFVPKRSSGFFFAELK